MRIVLVAAVILAVVFLVFHDKPAEEYSPAVPAEEITPAKSRQITIPTHAEPVISFKNEAEKLQRSNLTEKSNGFSTEVEGSTFSPKEKALLPAVELLERRKSDDPEEELQNLKPMDFKDEEAGMLSGRFRDEENDVEFRLSELEQDSKVPASKICLVAPKIGLKENSVSPKHYLRVDTTGYGVIRLSGGLYVRLMWSFENQRIIHGQIIRIEGDLPRILMQFNAVEKSALRSEELKYCR